MISGLYAIGRVVGAEILMAGFGICAVLYGLCCFLIRENRGKKSRRRVLLGFLIAAVACDLLWFLFYFPGGEYRNYGLGGVFAVFLWPCLLLLAGAIVTAYNAAETDEEA